MVGLVCSIAVGTLLGSIITRRSLLVWRVLVPGLFFTASLRQFSPISYNHLTTKLDNYSATNHPSIHNFKQQIKNTFNK